MTSVESKATRISLFSLKTPQMRTFHLTWFAFFLAFFGWFGIAPLMAIVRDDLGLTKAQVGNTIIASVAITVVARLAIGWLCDRIGPRLAYSGLLVIGSIPVMSIGLAQSYETFLLFRLGDWRYWRVLRYHPVPHLGYVRAQRYRDGQRDNGGMGQHGRRRDADGDAAGADGSPYVRRG